MNVLIVIDMQTDFIDGALGTAEAVACLPRVREKIKAHRGLTLFTRDTHEETYMSTREGAYLPVPHCIRGTAGWEIHPALQDLVSEPPIDKPTFGSTDLAAYLSSLHRTTPIESITLVGVCTDICVISNAALIKATLPEVPICVDAACCAGVTPESHTRALEAMKMLQIDVI